MFGRLFKGADKSHEAHEVAESQSQPAPMPVIKTPQPLPNFDLIKPGIKKMTAESIKVRSSKSLDDIFADIIHDQPKFGEHI